VTARQEDPDAVNEPIGQELHNLSLPARTADLDQQALQVAVLPLRNKHPLRRARVGSVHEERLHAEQNHRHGWELGFKLKLLRRAVKNHLRTTRNTLMQNAGGVLSFTYNAKHPDAKRWRCFRWSGHMSLCLSPGRHLWSAHDAND
jgi:hypothetical protein